MQAAKLEILCFLFGFIEGRGTYLLVRWEAFGVIFCSLGCGSKAVVFRESVSLMWLSRRMRLDIAAGGLVVVV